MALKDTKNVPHSLFVIGISLMLLVGAGVLILISNADDDKLELPAAETRTVTGIATKVIEDCVRNEELIDDEIDDEGPIICDGGSAVTVDGITIGTSSGFTTPEMSYGHDISAIVPGDVVEVVYHENAAGGFDLSCDACTIREL